MMFHDLAVDKLLPSSSGSANCSQLQKPPFFKSVLVERLDSLTKPSTGVWHQPLIQFAVVGS